MAALRVTAVTTLVALLGPSLTKVTAQNPGRWWPAAGTVMLAGGGLQSATADLFVDRLIALAGGPNAIIVVIPTASDGLPPQLPAPGPEPPRIQELRRQFESRGARDVVFLHTRDRRVANSEAFVRVLRSANAVFFPGGRSRVLDETYHGTLVERELKALLSRGGVLAGDSAGAITLGCAWLSWSSSSAPFGIVTYGLCVLPHVAVTPHVRPTNGRLGEDEFTDSVLAYVSTHGTTIGINVQENTVLVLRGSMAEVLGPGGVTLMDASKRRTGPYLRLASGAPRDLAH
jgi:cyanophycinase